MPKSDVILSIGATAIDDCWNKIGVQGDKSCPALTDHVHCRNCQIYSAAADKIMNRVVPDGYQDEWTRHFAQEASRQQVKLNSAIVFRMGDEWLAMSSLVLSEVSDLSTIHSIPHQNRKALLGLTNVRGGLLICMALNAFWGNESRVKPLSSLTKGARPRLIVIHRGGLDIGLPVDEVQGVEFYDPAQLLPVPSTLSKSSHRYCRGLIDFGKRSVGYLDEALVFDEIDRSLA